MAKRVDAGMSHEGHNPFREEHNSRGWTFDTFELHLQTEISSLERATNITLAASERAIEKAELADDKRFHLLNEFRDAMQDQQRNFADKEQTDFRLSAIDKTLGDIVTKQASYISADSAKSQGIYLVYGVVAQIIVIGIALYVALKHG